MTIHLSTSDMCLLPTILSDATANYTERAASAPTEQLAAFWAAEAAKAAALKELLNHATSIRVTTA